MRGSLIVVVSGGGKAVVSHSLVDWPLPSTVVVVEQKMRRKRGSDVVRVVCSVRCVEQIVKMNGHELMLGSSGA